MRPRISVLSIFLLTLALPVAVPSAARAASLSGNVQSDVGNAISGVTMTLSGAASATTTTSLGGFYSFAGLANGTYTVRPSRAGWTFSPASRTVTLTGASQNLPLFVGTMAAGGSFTLSGQVKNSTGGGMSGVTVSLSGAASRTTTTSSTGSYSFSVGNGSYTVTPSLAGWACAPPSQSTTVSGGNRALADFTCASLHSISGAVKDSSGGGLSGISMILSGAASRTTTTGGSGTYSFSSLPDGSYTVRPSSSAWTCAPSSRTTSLGGANRQLADFVCSPTGGSLGVTLRNVDGQARPSARCVLFDSSYQPLGATFERTSSGAGVCSWSNLAAGSYWVEAYYGAGPSPFVGEEYWGNLNVSVPAGATMARELVRSEPYAAAVELRLGNSGGPLLTASSVIAPGATVWVGVRVAQATSLTKSSSVQVVLDRSRDSLYDLDTQPSIPQNVGSGGAGTIFAFTITVEEPGPYFLAPAVRTQESTLTFTDRWDWTPAFTVAAPPADLEVTRVDVTPSVVPAGGSLTVSFTVGNAGGTDAGAMANEIWLSRDSDGTEPSEADGDVRLGNRNSSGIAAGTTQSFAGVFAAPSSPGTYFIKVRANAGNLVAETMLNNNVGVSAPVAVGAFGTTVITHGFQINFGEPDIQWVCDLADAIVRRAGSGKILFYDKDTGRFVDYAQLPESSRARQGCRQPSFSGPANGEMVLVFDWILESSFTAEGYSEAAGAALFTALIDPVNASVVQLDHLHLIGHSRGTVVNSEAVERLLAAGKPAPERVTMLDPADFYLPYLDFDVNFQKPYPPHSGIIAWRSQSTAYETYYQRDDHSWLVGRPIPGSTNVNLTDAFANSSCLCVDQHSWVHAWYHFTVAPQAQGVVNGEEFVPGWFGTGPRDCGTGQPGAMTQEGFAFSRLGGGLDPCPSSDGQTLVAFDSFSAREGIVNGDFARGQDPLSLPGWEQHGGGGLGILDRIGDNSLELTASHSLRVHDRVQVPPAAEQLAFMLRVKTADPDDVLRVMMTPTSGDLEPVIQDFDLTAQAGFSQKRVGIPASLRGRVVLPQFFLLPQGTSSAAVVRIDNVHFQQSGAPAKPYVLSVDVAGGGSGQVVSGEGTIACGSVCRAAYAGDQIVTLAATASPGSTFAGWSGDPDCAASGITMDADHSCTAVFELAPTAPMAPSWLRTTATSDSTIELRWDDNSNNETGFKIERKEGPAGPWTLIATLPANEATFDDPGLTCGTTFAYRVWAFNAAGDSSTTNEAAAIPECSCAEALTPDSLSFDALGGTASAAVTACSSWTAVSDSSWIEITGGASGTGNGTVAFRVGRNNVQSPRTGTLLLPELGLTFSITQAAAPADPGFSSFLRLESGTIAGQPVDSSHRTVTVAPGMSFSGTLSLRLDSSFGSNAIMALGITPSWGNHATSYTDLGGFSTPTVGLVRNVAIQYTAPTVPGTYAILAAFRGEFNAGQVMSATNWGVGALVWNNGDDIAAWDAGRIAAANREGTVLANYLLSGGNVPTWVPATGINVVVEPPSAQVPVAPSWLRTTPASPTSMDLLWDDNSNDEDGFKIERKEGPAGPWTLIATNGANAATFQDTGLTCGTNYAYRVWAFNAAGDSAKTNEAGATLTCSQLLSDEFQDGSSAGWQTWISGWNESGGVFHATNTGANLRNEAVWANGYGWADYSVEVDLALLGTYGPADGQLLLRYNSETDRIACRLFQYQSTRELQLLVPGRPLVSIPFNYATGQLYRLRASAVADNVTCEVVGHPETRLTQSSLGSSSGTVGLRNTHIPVDFDHLEVLPEAQ